MIADFMGVSNGHGFISLRPHPFPPTPTATPSKSATAGNVAFSVAACNSACFTMHSHARFPCNTFGLFVMQELQKEGKKAPKCKYLTVGGAG